MIRHTGKIDFACGNNKREGFFGIDKVETAATDAVCDLLSFPWPIATASVDEACCVHFFEHVPAARRKPFMEELHRVMKVGAVANFIVPLGDRMFQDYLHEWPPVVPGSFLYFNRDWLRQNRLDHGDYVTTADFDFTYRFVLHPEIAGLGDEERLRALQFYNNAASDLHVTLVRK